MNRNPTHPPALHAQNSTVISLISHSRPHLQPFNPSPRPHRCRCTWRVRQRRCAPPGQPPAPTPSPHHLSHTLDLYPLRPVPRPHRRRCTWRGRRWRCARPGRWCSAARRACAPRWSTRCTACTSGVGASTWPKVLYVKKMITFNGYKPVSVRAAVVDTLHRLPCTSGPWT